jgi:glycosyltransferase involved in cell wall biosynthesis
MARILSVVWYKILPARFGGQKGIAEFNEHLSFYHTLFCLCSKNNQSDQLNYTLLPELPETRVQVINPLNWLKINRKIHELGISHLILEHCYYGMAGIWAKRFSSAKLIVHAHNIESSRFREMGKWWWRFLWILEKNTYRHSDLVLFKTTQDQEFAISRFGLNESQCLVVPFGLNRTGVPAREEKDFSARLIRQKHHIALNDKILLFSGTLDYLPNAKALRCLVEEIIPLLCERTNQSFKLLVCGRIIFPEFKYLLDLRHDHFIYAGDVENMENYLLAADVFVNPVTEGGGIKVKSLEALSYNLPVVSTEHSARGIHPDLTGGKLFVCADNNWTAFCRLITESWNEKTDTPPEFFEKYHWRQVMKPFLEKINTL